jgi:hypothetical protein
VGGASVGVQAKSLLYTVNSLKNAKSFYVHAIFKERTIFVII